MSSEGEEISIPLNADDAATVEKQSESKTAEIAAGGEILENLH